MCSYIYFSSLTIIHYTYTTTHLLCLPLTPPRTLLPATVVFNEDSILSITHPIHFASKVACDEDIGEGLTEWAELAIRQTIKIAQANLPTEFESARGPLVKHEDIAIKDKDESMHVEKGNNAIKRVGTGSVDPTIHPRLRGEVETSRP